MFALYIPDNVSRRHKKLCGIEWTTTAQNWNKSITSVLVDSSSRSHLFTSATVRIPVHTAPKWGTDTFPICEASLSRPVRSSIYSFRYRNRAQNHRSYMWTEALTGIVFAPAQELTGILRQKLRKSHQFKFLGNCRPTTPLTHVSALKSHVTRPIANPCFSLGSFPEA